MEHFCAGYHTRFQDFKKTAITIFLTTFFCALDFCGPLPIWGVLFGTLKMDTIGVYRKTCLQNRMNYHVFSLAWAGRKSCVFHEVFQNRAFYTPKTLTYSHFMLDARIQWCKTHVSKTVTLIWAARWFSQRIALGLRPELNGVGPMCRSL